MLSSISRRSASQRAAPRCRPIARSKMYVPSDSFGGLSPEKKASQAMESLLTFAAVKIVLAQLEGSGRGALGAYHAQQYETLVSHVQGASLSDPHAWLQALLVKDKLLALRLLEVRSAYASTDFEWDQLQRLSVNSIKSSNLRLMREAAVASLNATEAAEPAGVAAVTAAAGAPQQEQQQLQQQAADTQPTLDSSSRSSESTVSMTEEQEQ